MSETIIGPGLENITVVKTGDPRSFRKQEVKEISPPGHLRWWNEAVGSEVFCIGNADLLEPCLIKTNLFRSITVCCIVQFEMSVSVSDVHETVAV